MLYIQFFQDAQEILIQCFDIIQSEVMQIVKVKETSTLGDMHSHMPDVQGGREHLVTIVIKSLRTNLPYGCLSFYRRKVALFLKTSACLLNRS